MRVTRFTPLSISLNSWHPFLRHSCSPSPLAFSTSSLVILTSSCPSLQTPVLFSKHANHPSSTHARIISLHSSLPSKPLIPSIPTSPLGPLPFFLYQCCTTHCSHHCSLSPSEKLPFHFPSNTMSHSHITSLCEKSQEAEAEAKDVLLSVGYCDI